MSGDKRSEALRLAQALNGSLEPALSQDDVELITEALRAMALPSAIEESTDSVGDWQCRDYADGWITFPDRKAAEKYQADTGALMRYRRYYQAVPSHVEEPSAKEAQLAQAVKFRNASPTMSESVAMAAAYVAPVPNTGSITCEHGTVGYCSRCALRDPGEFGEQKPQLVHSLAGSIRLDDATRSSIGAIPIDINMIMNAKEAEKVGMDRITISVPVKDLLYASAPVSARAVPPPQPTYRMIAAGMAALNCVPPDEIAARYVYNAMVKVASTDGGTSA